MRWFFDAVYLIGALLTAPIWLIRMAQTGKIRTDWRARFGAGDVLPEPSDRGRLLIHAVSVGELNAVRGLVEAIKARDDAPEIVIATTTDTGYAHARRHFGERFAVMRYPFDVSFAVERFLYRVKPTTVVLVELEVWPNFVALCRKRSIPVAVINGRLTERSVRRYRWVRPFIRSVFGSLSLVAAQNETYAVRFASMGVPRTRIQVLGTMKWDTAGIADAVAGADQLAKDMGIDRSRPLIVAGSTAPEEHELIQDATPEGVQLLCAPRKPEWFDAAAAVFPGCARRSRGEMGSTEGRYLLDTIGELRLAYALADVVIVGRTFVPLGGSDMIEPVGLGKATIVGPHVENFVDTANALLKEYGMVQTTRSDLAACVRALLDDADRRAELARNGRRVIRREQGATARHIHVLWELLGRNTPCRLAGRQECRLDRA